ncbi:MAG: DUF6370 family protein [Planctomycetota bacterium]
MRRLLVVPLLLLDFACGESSAEAGKTDKSAKKSVTEESAELASQSEVFEVGCAKCTYHLEGVEGCQAAIKKDDKVLLLSGHSFKAMAEGLCKTPKKARIAGKESGNTFVVTNPVRWEQ